MGTPGLMQSWASWGPSGHVAHCGRPSALLCVVKQSHFHQGADGFCPLPRYKYPGAGIFRFSWSSSEN